MIDYSRLYVTIKTKVFGAYILQGDFCDQETFALSSSNINPSKDYRYW